MQNYACASDCISKHTFLQLSVCGHWINDPIIEPKFCTKEKREQIAAEEDVKKKKMTCRKINRICHKIFACCNTDMPGGKVLHLGWVLAMNWGKDNDVKYNDEFTMTGHATCNKVSNIAKEKYFTHSSSAAMHVMSRATDKKNGC